MSIEKGLIRFGICALIMSFVVVLPIFVDSPIYEDLFLKFPILDKILENPVLNVIATGIVSISLYIGTFWVVNGFKK